MTFEAGGGVVRRGARGEALLLAVLVVLVLTGAWLAGRATPTLGYAANVLVHAIGGLAAAALLILWMVRVARSGESPAMRRLALTGGLLLLVSAGFAAVVIAVYNTKANRWLVHVHVGLAIPAAALLLAYAVLRLLHAEPSRGRNLALASLAAVVLAAPAMLVLRADRDAEAQVIRNPPLPPLTMDAEAMGGAQGPFHPSSVVTSTGGHIPSRFFMRSESCGQSGCHPDIFRQWNSSMHHFSSFNNQFYRKSIEYMQDVVGTSPSKWCGGCHDPAILMSGMMDTPIEEIVHTPEAQAGLACTLCHSITHVDSTMGQGDFQVEYPPLHELADSDNALLRGIHDFTVRLNPRPHAKTFMKTFHREQQGDFCSSCHKVHLDLPVNNYRWMRGFNDYDNWQASGVSGMGARSFYYPPASKDCADCHMPLVESDDKGNVDGLVHSHRFAAANTAVPLANNDQEQLEAVKKFLQGVVTVDVFALVRDAPAASAGQAVQGGESQLELASQFAVGEEGGAMGEGAVVHREPGEVIAPLDGAGAAVRRGESVRVDVVVRTRGLGHFFPGGTVDAFDVWVELEGKDSNGRTVFWSGMTEDEGRGPVEPGAHFYRSLAVDAHGNAINKRNAWSSRAMVYVRLVPPGAADTVHYRLDVPEDCGDEITLTARLNYRKFSHFYTQFAYGGVSGEGEVSADFDDRVVTFDGDLSKVSGELKEIPDVPTIVMSTSTAKLAVVDPKAPLAATQPAAVAGAMTKPVGGARERWNDYGIGLLLQGDLTGALRAFQRVTEIEPAYPDGWVNIGRVRLREGDNAAAIEAAERALSLSPDLARAQFIVGSALRKDGDYEGSLARLGSVHRQFPKDRVVVNEIAHVHYLMRDFAAAVEWATKTLAIDPEDLPAHYRLMLAYRGLGDSEKSRLHETYYRRFKIDEDAQELTGEYRRKHPHDNVERQPIHEHRSVPLPVGVTAAAAASEAAGQ